jgi:outer membrane protein assembly factor BamB
VVDAGAVLLALTPAGELVVYEPSDKEFKEIAKYKVADGGTYAYPIVAGNRVFVKDKDSVALWAIE